MKRITTREFLHGPGLVKTMKAGQNLLVTDKGKPSFLITKVGARPRKTRADLEREVLEICPKPRPKVNFTAALAEMDKQ
jgi:antitoxin (DNA-binding transcriptional repressor) of toxin-antitoxin stability system